MEYLHAIQCNSVDLAGSPAACRRIRTRAFFSAIDEGGAVR
jgi:hypothetical protein